MNIIDLMAGTSAQLQLQSQPQPQSQPQSTEPSVTPTLHPYVPYVRSPSKSSHTDFDTGKICKTMNKCTIGVMNTYIEVYFAVCNPYQWHRTLRSVFNFPN